MSKPAGALCSGFRIFGLALLILLSAAAAQAQFQVPALTGPVVDQAKLLDAPTRTRLDAALRALRDQGGSQMAVLTVPSLEGLTIEQASIQVADQWKLGSEKGDNGVLLMVSAGDRAVRIEVGQGLEGVLTDVESKRIIEDAIIPLFRTGDYAGGILVGAYQITQKTDPTIDLTSYFEGVQTRTPQTRERRANPISVIVFLIALFFMFVGGGPRGRRMRGMGPFYGGWGGAPGGMGRGGFGGGSGGWSGGGGGFSGGGASGRW